MHACMLQTRVGYASHGVAGTLTSLRTDHLYARLVLNLTTCQRTFMTCTVHFHEPKPGHVQTRPCAMCKPQPHTHAGMLVLGHIHGINSALNRSRAEIVDSVLSKLNRPTNRPGSTKVSGQAAPRVRSAMQGAVAAAQRLLQPFVSQPDQHSQPDQESVGQAVRRRLVFIQPPYPPAPPPSPVPPPKPPPSPFPPSPPPRPPRQFTVTVQPEREAYEEDDLAIAARLMRACYELYR